MHKFPSRTILSSSTQTAVELLTTFNMFARATSAFVLALPVLAAANVLPRNDGGGPSNQCNTGSLQCCNSAVAVSDLFLQLHSTSSDGHFIKAQRSDHIHAPRPSRNCCWIRYRPRWSYVFPAIVANYATDRIDPLVTCSPLTILAGGGSSCSAQPVCCTGNNFVSFVF